MTWRNAETRQEDQGSDAGRAVVSECCTPSVDETIVQAIYRLCEERGTASVHADVVAREAKLQPAVVYRALNRMRKRSCSGAPPRVKLTPGSQWRLTNEESTRVKNLFDVIASATVEAAEAVHDSDIERADWEGMAPVEAPASPEVYANALASIAPDGKVELADYRDELNAYRNEVTTEFAPTGDEVFSASMFEQRPDWEQFSDSGALAVVEGLRSTDDVSQGSAASWEEFTASVERLPEEPDEGDGVPVPPWVTEVRETLGAFRDEALTDCAKRVMGELNNCRAFVADELETELFLAKRDLRERTASFEHERQMRREAVDSSGKAHAALKELTERTEALVADLDIAKHAIEQLEQRISVADASKENLREKYKEVVADRNRLIGECAGEQQRIAGFEHEVEELERRMDAKQTTWVSRLGKRIGDAARAFRSESHDD